MVVKSTTGVGTPGPGTEKLSKREMTRRILMAHGSETPTAEVRRLIKEQYGINVSAKEVLAVRRKEFGVAKPTGKPAKAGSSNRHHTPSAGGKHIPTNAAPTPPRKISDEDALAIIEGISHLRTAVFLLGGWKNAVAILEATQGEANDFQ